VTSTLPSTIPEWLSLIRYRWSIKSSVEAAFGSPAGNYLPGLPRSARSVVTGHTRGQRALPPERFEVGSRVFGERESPVHVGRSLSVNDLAKRVANDFVGALHYVDEAPGNASVTDQTADGRPAGVDPVRLRID
jgi:hypothetical protein